MSYNRFFYRYDKDPEQLTVAELEGEIESAKEWHDYCAEVGQGIASKESVRRRCCEQELEKRRLDIAHHRSMQLL